MLKGGPLAVSRITMLRYRVLSEVDMVNVVCSEKRCRSMRETARLGK